MPIYEYKCNKCGRHFEKRQAVSDAPLTECEKCGGPVEKQWSLSGFQFKGDGWYVTDYSKKTSEDKNKDLNEKTPAGDSTAATDTASNVINDASPKAKTKPAKS